MHVLFLDCLFGYRKRARLHCAQRGSWWPWTREVRPPAPQHMRLGGSDVTSDSNRKTENWQRAKPSPAVCRKKVSAKRRLSDDRTWQSSWMSHSETERVFSVIWGARGGGGADFKSCESFMFLFCNGSHFFQLWLKTDSSRCSETKTGSVANSSLFLPAVASFSHSGYRFFVYRSFVYRSFVYRFFVYGFFQMCFVICYFLPFYPFLCQNVQLDQE